MPTHDHDCSDWLHGQVVHARKDFQGIANCGIYLSHKLKPSASAWDAVTCEDCLKTVELCTECKGSGAVTFAGHTNTCRTCKGSGTTTSYVCHKDFCDDPRRLSEGMEQLYGRHEPCMSDDLIEMIRQAEDDARRAKEQHYAGRIPHLRR